MRVRLTASAKRSGSWAKPGARHVDHRRREQQRQRQQHDLAGQQQREDAVGEQLSPRGAALLADARIGRNKGGIEGAFGENGAEMIRQPESHEKGVGRRPCAEDRGQHDVTDKTGDPRQQRQAADREDSLDHGERASRRRKIADLERIFTMRNKCDSQ